MPNKINKARLSGWNLPAFSLGMKRVFTVLLMVWVELFGSSSENDLTPADKQEHRQLDAGAGLTCCLWNKRPAEEQMGGRRAGFHCPLTRTNVAEIAPW